MISQRRQKNIQNIFVLSTGRTGTTYLTSYLQKHCPQVTCVQEPFPGWFFQLMSHRSATNRLSSPWKQLTETVLKTTYIHALNHCPTKIRVEVNPFLYGLTPALTSVLGSFRIIHMVRHPFGFIRSMLNFKPGGLKNFLFHSSLWNPPLAKIAGCTRQDWNSLSFFEQRAWLWRFENQTIIKSSHLCENYQILRFEDLTNPDLTIRAHALTQLSKALTLNTTLPNPISNANLIRNASSERNPSTAGIPASMLPTVSKICGSMMNEWGYQSDGTTTPLESTPFV